MEKTGERDEEENLLVQIMEGDADYSAVCACVKLIFVQARNAGAFDSSKEPVVRKVFTENALTSSDSYTYNSYSAPFICALG